MKDWLRRGNWEYLGLGVVVAAAAFLLLARLGECYLWQDEAQTALVSKTILHRGMPYGTDGTNFFSQEDGAEYGKDYIWKWHTWLQFYLVAGSFAVFGVNTFAARLPFALMGVGTVVATYFLARKLTGSKRAAVFTGVLLTICVPFLLLSRQCRYYSATSLFSVLGMLAYLQVIEGKRWGPVFFVTSATLLFHSHYIYCATLIAAVLVHMVLLHRNRLKAVLVSTAVIVGLNIPWAIWLMGMKYGERYGSTAFRLDQAMAFLWAYIGYIGEYLFRPALLPVPLLVLIVCVLRKAPAPFFATREFGGKMLLPVLFTVSTLVALCLSIPYPFFRYLAPLLPVFIILAGCVAEAAALVHVTLGIVAVALLAWFSPLRDFAYEITHDHPGPVKGICQFLNEHAKPGETVAITYEDMPVKFYTKLKVIGAITGDPVSEAVKADWIIVRKYRNSRRELKMREALLRLVTESGPKKYRAYVIEAREAPYENSEDPRVHRYRVPEGESKVVICQRIG